MELTRKFKRLFKKLQILPLTSQYMLSLVIMFVVQNKKSFPEKKTKEITI